MKELEKYCFVIQPISDTRFTKRFDDIYKPAIESTGLKAYRVDLDPSVKTPIEDIERGINNAIICFADITTDNPNVWYELGYSFAKKKSTIMVCEEGRSKFPFDVSHRSIIPYKTESSSDFEKLSAGIIAKCLAYSKDYEQIERVLDSPIKEALGLQPYEIAILSFVIGNQITDEQRVSIYLLLEKMEKSGFTKTAVSIGLRLLKQKNLILTMLDHDYNGNEYDACKLTDEGFNFVLQNINLFDLSQQTQQIQPTQFSNSDDLPF